MASKKPQPAFYSGREDGLNFAVMDKLIAQANSQNAKQPDSEGSGWIRQGLGDKALGFASGAVGAAQAISNLAGADNAASKVLGGANKGIESYLSPEAKAAKLRQAKLMESARAKGFNLDGAAAGVEAFAQAPVQTMIEGAGSIVPIAAAALAGVPAAVATGIGMGAGGAKGAIFDEIKNRGIKAGLSEEEATAQAVEAQNYLGKNADQIAIGGALGAADSLTGAGKIASGMLRNAVLKPAAKEVAKKSAAELLKAPRGLFGRTAMGVASEVPLEMAQGGQEQVAANLAAQRAGYEAGTWDKVASKAIMEGLASAGPGGAFGAMHTGPKKIIPPAPTVENDKAAAEAAAAQLLAEQQAAAKKAAVDAAHKAAEAPNSPISRMVAAANPLTPEEAWAKAQELDAQAALDEANGVTPVIQAPVDVGGSVGDGQGGVNESAPIDNDPTVKDSLTTQPAFDVQAAQEQYRAETLAAQQAQDDELNAQAEVALAKMAQNKQKTRPVNEVVSDGGYLHEGTQDGDVLNGMGKPFTLKLGALQEAKRQARENGGEWTIAPVFDGFVARKKAQNQPLAPVEPAQEATETVVPSEVERYQWQRNAEGGQERGNQQTIQPLTEALFSEYIAPKVAVKSYRDYQQQFPAATHISLVQKADGSVELGAGGVGPIDKLRPSAAPVEKGWVKAVDSFDSPEAVAHGGSADSGAQNEIDKAAHEAATSHLNDKPQPTDAQKEAGNYEKGHITVHGMPMAIENPKGSTRSGVSPDGTAWSNTMGGHYGYFKGTIGNDKDHVDGYVGPNPESNRVFVIDQVNKDGSFDEHKIILGATSLKEARQIYLSSYSKGWGGIGAISELPVRQFKLWLKHGDKKKPYSDEELHWNPTFDQGFPDGRGGNSNPPANFGPTNTDFTQADSKVDIPGIGPMPSVGGGDPSSDKRVSDGSKIDPKVGGDVLQGHAGVAHSDGLFNGPGQVSEQVLSDMGGLARNGQVLNGVVKPIPVNVVNDLRGEKSSSNVSLHNDAMLKPLATDSVNLDADKPVGGAMSREGSDVSASGRSTHDVPRRLKPNITTDSSKNTQQPQEQTRAQAAEPQQQAATGAEPVNAAEPDQPAAEPAGAGAAEVAPWIDAPTENLIQLAKQDRSSIRQMRENAKGAMARGDAKESAAWLAQAESRAANEKRIQDEIARRNSNPDEDLTTVEGVARAVQLKVASNRRKSREKSRKEREAKGYAPNSTPESEQADYEAEISAPPSDMQKQSAAAMLGTDPLPLIRMFVNGNFEASKDVFKALTGVKIRGLSAAAKKAALYQWAKWTPEQIAQAEGDAQARKDEAAEKNRQDDLKSAVMDTWLGLDRLKVKEKDGTESTGQEFVLKSVASGFDKAHAQKKGAATVYGLTDGARFISLKAKPFTKFVKAAIACGGLDKALAYVNPHKPQAPEGFVDRSIDTANSNKADAEAKREFKTDELLSASDLLPYYEQEIQGVDKGVIVPNPRFELGTISEATAKEVAIYIDGYTGEQRRLRVSGRTIKHIEEMRPGIAKEIVEQLPSMFISPDEVLPDHKHPHKRALLVKNGPQKAGDSKPKSHVATVEVEIEVEVNDGFIDIVTIMTAPDRSLKAARELKNNWSEGQQRTEQAVNSPHPLTAEAANPEADSPDTRPVADSLPEPTEYSKRPKNWDKNYGSASKIAEAMGIALRGANGKMKKAPELVADIRAADVSKNQQKVDTSAEPVQKPAESGQIVQVSDIYGRTHRVAKSDLDGSGDRIPTIRSNGDVVAGEEIPRSTIKTEKSSQDEQPQKDRKYNLIAVNEKTGEKTTLTKSPVSHAEAVTMKGKFDDKPGRRIQLEDATETVAPDRVATTHVGLKIYPIRVNIGGKAEDRWAVQTLNNAEREKNGERQIGGDPLAETLEQAKVLAEQEIASSQALAQRKAESQKSEQEKASQDAAEKTAFDESQLGRFIADSGYTSMRKGAATLALKKLISFKGESVETHQFIESLVADGYAPILETENRVADKSSREWNRMDNRQQAAHERKVKEGGTVEMAYMVKGDSQYSIGKTEYAYAKYLQGSEPVATGAPTIEEVKAELPPLTKARNFLMELEAKLEAQGRVVDDRLVQMIRQQKAVIKELEAEQGKAQDLPSQEASNTIQSSPSEDAITEAKATIESLDAQIKRHEELLGCLG